MPTTITMPQLGETVTEGTVAQWLKKVGDAVEKYEAFVEVSTDKVNAEVPSPVSGTIRELIVSEGQTVPTGAPIAVIDEVGAPAEPAPNPAVATDASADAGRRGSPPGASSNGKPLAADARRTVSPAVRRLAREYAVDLATVEGTGTNGRVTARDVEARLAVAAVPAPARAGTATVLERRTEMPGETIPLTRARRLIAQRMVESKHTAPHAWTMVEVDVSGLVRRRAALKEAFERANGVKLTLLPFFLRAVVESLGAFPLMNATFNPDGIRLHREINLGIAVAAGDNLLVPVIQRANERSVEGLALAAAALVDAARRGKLGADELAGGTFTVNNTGANGSVLSAPILVSGQTGIVTMEAVVKRVVVRDDDAIAIRSMMNVCLSLDHRAVDGAVASGFLVDLKRRLEAIGPHGSL